MQIFDILSLLKMLLLTQLGENLFCKVSRWQGQAIFSTSERHYIGDDFAKILHYFHLYLLKYFNLSSKSLIFCSVQLGLSVTWVVIQSYSLRFYYFLEKQYLMIKRATFQTISVTRSKVIHLLIK